MLVAAAALRRNAEKQFKKTAPKQRLFTAFDYTAGTWRRIRWVIAKAEHTDQGSNPRFLVTNIVGGAQKLYDRPYGQRGEMENRVKEQLMLSTGSALIAGGPISGGCPCPRWPTR